MTRPSSCRIHNQRVTAYIDANGCWKEEDIRRDFARFEAEEILRTRIGEKRQRDVRIWKYHPSGKYTVSSGYTRGAEMMAMSKSKESTSGSAREGVWWSVI